jgi:hypothetical protein
MIRNNRENKLRSVSFGAEMAVRPHSVPREVADLREDVELAFERLEGNDHIPVIMHAALTLDVGAAEMSGDLYGVNFLAGNSLASLSLGDLTISAPGDAANSISVLVEAPAGALAVSSEGKQVTISPAAGGSTWADIAAALVADADISALINVADDEGGNSATAAVAEQFLSGGTGDGIKVFAHNVIKGLTEEITQFITELSDTKLSLVGAPPAALDIAANDIIALRFESHTAMSNHVSGTAHN